MPTASRSLSLTVEQWMVKLMTPQVMRVWRQDGHGQGEYKMGAQV